MTSKRHQSVVLLLQDKVAHAYYTHGLFCSMHPVPVLCFAAIIVLLCCYPLVYLPLPGSMPQEHSTSISNYKIPPEVWNEKSETIKTSSATNESLIKDGTLGPQWYAGAPSGYILQIVIRSAVSPWHQGLSSTSSLKASIRKVFDVVETLKNYQHVTENGSFTLDDFCVHVSESVVKQMKEFLPSYGCLVVSPANMWKHNVQLFLSDGDPVRTIYNFGGLPGDQKPSNKDIFFGIPWKETGIKKFTYSNQRVLTYAVTIVMKKYNELFLQGLMLNLQKLYPVFNANNNNYYNINNTISSKNITHIYFHSQFNFVEFVPLIVTYVILFLYIYFSVRKIAMVKSKIGMAFSAVVTVVMSLCMSVGLCTWFGLSFTLKAGQIYLKDIFPYLVVIVGLENILVLTKSVVATPVQLDVKVRVAQGLSKEGWSITKNLITELSILTFGFFTFVPAIQEFCLFAVVGLLSDFFLQLVFFATVLSIDIRRMEISDIHRQMRLRGSIKHEKLSHMYPLFPSPLLAVSEPNYNKSSSVTVTSPSTSQSESDYPTSTIVSQFSEPVLRKIPKRLRLVYFWARIRIFQRAFMVCFSIWVGFMVYKSGIVSILTVDNVLNATATSSANVIDVNELPITAKPFSFEVTIPDDFSTTPNNVQINEKIDPSQFALPKQQQQQQDVPFYLKHKYTEQWRSLPRLHWPTLFGYYNISLRGRYVSILPSVKLSIPVSPEDALQMQQSFNPEYSSVPWFPKFDAKDEFVNEQRFLLEDSGQAYYPSSPSEMVLAAVLAIPTLIFLVYLMVVLYHCICTRNYAEWRSSWSQDGVSTTGDIYTQLVFEAMPVLLDGHHQEVECLAIDGHFVVSSCLNGEIRVWDSFSGDCVTVIERKCSNVKRKPHTPKEMDYDEYSSDYESGSPPSRSDTLAEHKPRSLSSSHLSNLGSSPVLHYEDPHMQEFSFPGDNSAMAEACSSSSSMATTPNKKNLLFKYEPELSSTIKTNFSELNDRKHLNFKKSNSNDPDLCGASGGNRGSPVVEYSAPLGVRNSYDFSSHFQVLYDEHMQLMSEEAVPRNESFTHCGPFTPTSGAGGGMTFTRSHSGTGIYEGSSLHHQHQHHEEHSTSGMHAAIWCLDCQDSLIAVGCADGSLEFWDSMTGSLKCSYKDGPAAVSGVRIQNDSVVAVRLNGSIDFLEIGMPTTVVADLQPISISKHRRTHTRQSSEASVGKNCQLTWEGEELFCSYKYTARAHQQPIAVFEVEGGKVVTGSCDHTLKMFRLEDATCLATLHGHHGPITALFIDKLSPMTAASGSQDGAICVWDLLTGTCVCRLKGHDGAVTALSYTANYILSAGTDDRLFVWERFQGHLLNTINLQHSYCSAIVMLTDNLLLTGRQGSLVVWDIKLAEPVRIVRLGHNDENVLVRQIRHVGHAIVCDYGNQLRVVRFPTIVEKVE